MSYLPSKVKGRDHLNSKNAYVCFLGTADCGNKESLKNMRIIIRKSRKGARSYKIKILLTSLYYPSGNKCCYGNYIAIIALNSK